MKLDLEVLEKYALGAYGHTVAIDVETLTDLITELRAARDVVEAARNHNDYNHRDLNMYDETCPLCAALQRYEAVKDA